MHIIAHSVVQIFNPLGHIVIITKVRKMVQLRLWWFFRGFLGLRNFVTQLFATHANHDVVDSIFVVTLVLVDPAESLPGMVVGPQCKIHLVVLHMSTIVYIKIQG